MRLRVFLVLRVNTYHLMLLASPSRKEVISNEGRDSLSSQDHCHCCLENVL